MRRWVPVILPIVVTIECLVVGSVVPLATMLVLVLTISALVLATVVVAVFTKETALARRLVATLVWGLVLFELVLR
jgi:hypothetical protein